LTQEQLKNLENQGKLKNAKVYLYQGSDVFLFSYDDKGRVSATKVEESLQLRGMILQEILKTLK